MYGVDLDFTSGLNIVQADNTSGKSTCLQAIIYVLGLERSLSANLSVPLPFAMRERIHETKDDPYEEVLQSYVEIEVCNHRDEKLRIRRSIVGDADPKLISTWSTEEAEDDGPVRETQRDFFVHDPGSATRESGFHHFLADFLGWELPDVPRFDGTECPLYVETLFPMFFVEQKRGWSTVQGPLPTHFRIQDINRRVLEFVLNLDAGKVRRERAELNKRIGFLESDWTDKRRVLSKGGVDLIRFIGVPKTPTAEFSHQAAISLEVFTDGEWLPLELASKELQDEIEKLNNIELVSTEEAEASTQQALEVAQLKYDELGAMFEVARTDFRAVLEENRALKKRLEVLDIDLKRHQDTKKLMALGSEVADAVAFESCPTCHQHLNQELLPPSSSGAMALDENIAFIKSQQLMYKSALAATEERLGELRLRGRSIEQDYKEAQSELRSLKRALVRPASSVSRATIEKSVRLQARVDQWQEMQERADGLVDDLVAIAKEWAILSSRLKELRTGDDFSSEDKNKISRLQSLIQGHLKTFDFHSFPPSEITLARDNFRPQVLVFDKDSGGEIEKDIGFEASASDGIRLKWSYYLSLLELDENYDTNHAGLVVFDEPGQQAADPVNLTSLFQESAKVRPDRHQILIATSEKEHAIKEGLGDRPYNLISFSGYILKPLS
ncbi:ATP-binding protein [Salipiger mucosus]|uniref:ATP-binding protein n=1 Tax=Salipiger mucosus TaxID=263378 RepID=UPI001C2F441E|nr:ATP-binding protein [Salipiger mucosus]